MRKKNLEVDLWSMRQSVNPVNLLDQINFTHGSGQKQHRSFLKRSSEHHISKSLKGNGGKEKLPVNKKPPQKKCEKCPGVLDP